MTAEQLTAKIKANPVLLPHFSDYDGEESDGSGICPCCVRRVVELPNQKQVENLLDTLIRCDSHIEKINAQIDEMTRVLQERRDLINILYNDTIRRLHEMKNTKLSPV